MVVNDFIYIFQYYLLRNNYTIRYYEWDLINLCGCFPFEYRYDLRIRYVPVNFLEKFKDDRSTLLYFYQQVTSYIVFYLVLQHIALYILNWHKV